MCKITNENPKCYLHIPQPRKGIYVLNIIIQNILEKDVKERDRKGRPKTIMPSTWV
jgi:hypothetical protein